MLAQTEAQFDGAPTMAFSRMLSEIVIRNPNSKPSPDHMFNREIYIILSIGI